MDNNLDIFSQRVKELRNKAGLTQKELAEKMGVSINTVVSYEKLQKSPSLDMAKKMATFFNVSLDWLSGMSNDIDSFQIHSPSDLIKLVIKLDSVDKIAFKNIAEIDDMPEMVTVIDDNSLKSFVVEWQKIKKLKDSKTIDEDLYNLWIEKQISLPKYTISYHALRKEAEERARKEAEERAKWGNEDLPF